MGGNIEKGKVEVECYTRGYCRPVKQKQARVQATWPVISQRTDEKS